MSDFNVYEGEMTNNRLSDQDIERFFSGQTSEDEALARLAVHVGAWHVVYERVPSGEEVTTFAAEAAEIAASTTPAAVPRAAPAAVSPFMRFKSTLRRKFATGLAAVLLLSGMTAVAVASDAAAPGDTLYGLDQTLEAVGILDGGAAERIAEAQSLFNDGLVAEAIGHAAGAVEHTDAAAGSFSPESSKAAEALTNAADHVMSEGEEPSEDVRNAVAAMLTQMANMIEDPQIDGATFGENVSDLAKEIAGAPDELPDAADNAADEAEENGEKNSEDAGPPEDVPADPPEGTPDTP